MFVTKELCLSEESLSVIPRVLCNFTMLQRLDISRNLFRSLPVKIIDEYLPSLRALDVSYNRLENMRNVQQLGILKELRELNLLGNPLLAINQRADLLAHLIFGNKRPRRDRLEAMLQYQTENVGRVSAAQQALPAGTAAAESKPKVIASESTSRMMISGLSVGGVLPTHAVKILNSAVSASAREYGAVVYADLTPAPVPRATGTPFRMLTQLNNKRITKEGKANRERDEIQSALRCGANGCTTHVPMMPCLARLLVATRSRDYACMHTTRQTTPRPDDRCMHKRVRP